MTTLKNITKFNKQDFRLFLHYLIPSLTGMILISAYTFADGFVLGQKLGEDALGALGIVTPALMFAFSIGSMFGLGGGSIYSIYLGESDTQSANKIFSTSFVCALVNALIFMILGLIFVDEIGRFLGGDSKTMPYVREYLIYMFIGYPFVELNMVMSCFVKNDQHPNFAMITTTVGAGLNVIVDFVFVFGFDMGMMGAALATTICQAIAFLMNFIYAYAKKLNIRFYISNVAFSQVWRIIKNGFSAFVLEFSSGIVTFVFITIALKYYNTLGSSIYTVIVNWSIIANAMVMGVTNAAQPLISISYGQKAYERMSNFFRYSLLCATIFGLFFIIIGYIFTSEWVVVFNDSKDLVRETVPALQLYMPTFLIIGVTISCSVYFQSIEKPKQSTIISLLHGAILPIFFAVTMSLCFGRNGLWLSAPVSEIMVMIVAIYLLKKKHNFI